MKWDGVKVLVMALMKILASTCRNVAGWKRMTAEETQRNRRRSALASHGKDE